MNLYDYIVNSVYHLETNVLFFWPSLVAIDLCHNIHHTLSLTYSAENSNHLNQLKYTADAY